MYRWPHAASSPRLYATSATALAVTTRRSSSASAAPSRRHASATRDAACAPNGPAAAALSRACPLARSITASGACLWRRGLAATSQAGVPRMLIRDSVDTLGEEGLAAEDSFWGNSRDSAREGAGC